MAKLQILHLDCNHPLLLQELEKADFENHQDYTSTKEEIESKIEHYHGIVIRSRFKIDKTFIDKAKNLQFIARVGAGLESIDVEYAKTKNIALIAAPEGNQNAVGEHTLGMILSLFNKLNRADSQVKNGNWNREGNRGLELEGKTIGIIGYGNMGKSFAKKLRGFDVAVIFHDIKINIANSDAKQVSLQELQEQCDVLSLHVPWTPETDKMVNAEFINSFAKPFWLLNTSRGKNVVTADLVLALQSGKILGAGLDVLEYEKTSFEILSEKDKISESFAFLANAENVLLTPHIAGWTVESHQKLAQTIVDKIKSLYDLEHKKEIQKPAITGLGAIMFKANNPANLRKWYADNLGFDVTEYGTTFWWFDKYQSKCSTSWSPIGETSAYFEPSKKPFMLNFRVDKLDDLLVALRQKNCTVVGDPQSFEYGKFAWILDCEGNKIELWEPIDSAFE